MKGFFPAMFLIFLTLKLAGVIAWSWLWVTAPLWGGALLLGVVLLFGLFAIAAGSQKFRR